MLCGQRGATRPPVTLRASLPASSRASVCQLNPSSTSRSGRYRSSPYAFRCIRQGCNRVGRSRQLYEFASRAARQGSQRVLAGLLRAAACLAHSGEVWAVDAGEVDLDQRGAPRRPSRPRRSARRPARRRARPGRQAAVTLCRQLGVSAAFSAIATGVGLASASAAASRSARSGLPGRQPQRLEHRRVRGQVAGRRARAPAARSSRARSRASSGRSSGPARELEARGHLEQGCAQRRRDRGGRPPAGSRVVAPPRIRAACRAAGPQVRAWARW